MSTPTTTTVNLVRRGTNRIVETATFDTTEQVTDWVRQCAARMNLKPVFAQGLGYMLQDAKGYSNWTIFVLRNRS